MGVGRVREGCKERYREGVGRGIGRVYGGCRERYSVGERHGCKT